MTFLKRLLLTKVLILINFVCFSQNETNQSEWKNYTETISDEYLIKFEYPSYLKFDRIENCWCLGTATSETEYNNTMDWGIWIDEFNNYIEPNDEHYKTEFNNDVVIKKDSILISTYKALRTIAKQTHGSKYSESIVIKLNNCIFEILNKKSDSDDFKRFYRSIQIISK